MEIFQPPGSRLLRDPMDYRVKPLNAGEVVLVGIPWDWSTAGRPGARFSPSRVRSWLYRFTGHAPGSIDFKCGIVDMGDVRVAPGDSRVTGERVVEAARIAYSTGRLAVFLGGDHYITRWTSDPLASSRLGLLVLDAHYDMRSVEEGVTSGSWLWDLTLAHRGRVKAVIIGLSDYSNPEYMEARARGEGYIIVPRSRIVEDISEVLEAIDRLEGQGLENYYISIDADHLDISYAPGVNSPTPLGMTPWESLKILEYAAKKLRPRGVDLVEIVPDYDIAEMTIALTAKLLLHVINHTLNGCQH